MLTALTWLRKAPIEVPGCHICSKVQQTPPTCMWYSQLYKTNTRNYLQVPCKPCLLRTPQSNTPLLSKTVCYSLHISKHPPLSCVTHRWQHYQGVITGLSPMTGACWMMLTSFLKEKRKSSQVTIQFHFSFLENSLLCSEEGSPN